MITIRQTVAADATAIRDIIRESFMSSYVRFLPREFVHQTLKSGRFAEIARDDGQECVIGEVDGAPAGVLLLRGEYVEQLWIHPDHMGKGVGGALLRHAAVQAANNGHPCLTLNCFKRNANALGFYLAKGFVVDYEYTAKDYAPGERVCFMVKRL